MDITVCCSRSSMGGHHHVLDSRGLGQAAGWSCLSLLVIVRSLAGSCCCTVSTSGGVDRHVQCRRHSFRHQRPAVCLQTGYSALTSFHSSFTFFSLLSLKPILKWAYFCLTNILWTVWQTMICFLIELLVRQTWFGQFTELCFILNWLVMRCKLWPELAADVLQTAWLKNVG